MLFFQIALCGVVPIAPAAMFACMLTLNRTRLAIIRVFVSTVTCNRAPALTFYLFVICISYKGTSRSGGLRIVLLVFCIPAADCRIAVGCRSSGNIGLVRRWVMCGDCGSFVL